jgi:ArsR family transcriptional regulator
MHKLTDPVENLKKIDWEIYQLQAGFCKALSHPTRHAIIQHLKKDPCSVTELARVIGVKQANLSQHLAILRDTGILITKRSGLNILYSIADQRIIKACTLVREALEKRISEQRKLFQK